MIKFLEELDGEPTFTPENDAIFDQFHAQARKGLNPSDQQFFTATPNVFKMPCQAISPKEVYCARPIFIENERTVARSH